MSGSILSIIILAAFLIIAYMVWLIKKDKIEQARTTLPEMDIDFTELASIWMKYNANIQPLDVVDESNVANLFGEEEPNTEDNTADAKTPQDITLDKKAETTPKAEPTIEPAPNKPVDEVPKVDIPVKQADEKPKESVTAVSDNKAPVISLPENLESYKSFIENCINPYKKVIQEQGVATVIQGLVNLIEKHGHCPSVVIDNKDTESTELISVRENLAQVSLKDHTYFVCAKLIGIVKDNYKDFENMIPNAIVTALAHDIGKIPEFRVTGAYNSAEHSLVSASKLNELFAGQDVFWSNKAIQAVKEHHIHTDTDWSNYLKQADRQAREVELQKYTSRYEIKPFDTWFDVDTFLKKIEPYINIEQASNKWQAFSLKGVVYCKPDFIYETAKEMSKEAKALDLKFVYESEKDTVKRMVVDALRKQHLIPDVLSHTKYCRKFELKTKAGMAKKMEFMLTPIKADRYDIAKIEDRKQGFVEIIDTIVPR